MEPISDEFVYRNQKKHLPWWVKSVDQITTEIDETIMEKPGKAIVRDMPKYHLEQMLNTALALQGQKSMVG